MPAIFLAFRLLLVLRTSMRKDIFSILEISSSFLSQIFLIKSAWNLGGRLESNVLNSEKGNFGKSIALESTVIGGVVVIIIGIDFCWK